MLAVFEKIISPERLIKTDLRRGVLPSGRDAFGKLMHIAWPSIMEMVLVAMISMIDMMMVGGLGSYAISAVGLTTQPKFIFLTIFLAINVGSTAVVARRRGENNREDAGRCLRQSMMLTAVLSVALTAVALIFAPQIMTVAGANSETLDASVTYFRIVMSSLFFLAMSLNICAAQRGCGHTRIALKVNLTANLVNIVLNFLLIGGNFGFPRLEVAGAAIATSIGTVVGFVLALISILHPENFVTLRGKLSWKFDKHTLSSMWRVSGNALIEQVAVRIGFFIYAMMVARLGTEDFAAYQIVMQVLNISFAFGDGLGCAATSLVGQNLGAKRPDLSMLYAKLSQRLGLFVTALVITTFVALRYPIVSLFTTDAALIAKTAPLIIVCAFALPMQMSQPITSGCLRGAGDTRFVAVTMLISIMLIRPITCAFFLFGVKTGVVGAFFSFICDQYFRGTLLISRLHGEKWLKFKF